jgi:hypothetical protein
MRFIWGSQKLATNLLRELDESLRLHLHIRDRLSKEFAS